MDFVLCLATTCYPILNMDSLSSSKQTTFLPNVYDRVEGGHQMLTVCREIDHVLVFDTFDRSLEQIEKTIPSPISNVISLMHFQTTGYPLTRKFYRIQVRRFVDVMRLWSDDCLPITDLSKEYSNVSERCFQTMCWKMSE